MPDNGIPQQELGEDFTYSEEEFSLDDTGSALFPAAQAIQALVAGVNGALQKVPAQPVQRGGIIGDRWPENTPKQVIFVYLNADNVVVGLRSKVFAW